MKGARWIAPRSWAVDDFGPTMDRRWMVVRGGEEFVTQRTHPRLALVRTGLEDDGLTLAAPGMEPVSVPGPGAPGLRREVPIWSDRAPGVDVGADAAEWISTFLGEELRIVFMPDDAWRPVSRSHGRGRRVSFADGFPFLILSRGSMDALNERLERPVSLERFRPNLVVGGVEAHAEDRWRRIRIGEIELRVVKPCARCVVTTVDPGTGRKGVEPLRTLARYRKKGGSVYFGQNAIHVAPGRLEEGTPVEVLEADSPRPGGLRGPRRAGLGP